MKLTYEGEQIRASAWAIARQGDLEDDSYNVDGITVWAAEPQIELIMSVEEVLDLMRRLNYLQFKFDPALGLSPIVESIPPEPGLFDDEDLEELL